MAIQRRRIFTPAEVDRILRASERRQSHRGGPPGHTGGKHVLITNAQLADRAARFATDTPVACAFAGTPEAVRAVTEALNSAVGQRALEHLDETYPTGIRVCIEAEVGLLTVRYSSGWDIIRKAKVAGVCMIAERIEDDNHHGLHIQTAYPILFFRRGWPAWKDSRNVWHDRIT